MSMFNPHRGFRHVQYFETWLARNGKNNLRSQILQMSMEDRRELNETLAQMFEGKTFGEVDKLCFRLYQNTMARTRG